jgi:hypothetical protein
MSPVPRALSDVSNTLKDRSFVSAVRSTVEVTCNDFVKSKINGYQDCQHQVQAKMQVDPRNIFSEMEHWIQSR